MMRAVIGQSEVVKSHLKEDLRIIYIHHTKNEGVGGAIVTGYKWARENLSKKPIKSTGFIKRFS